MMRQTETWPDLPLGNELARTLARLHGELPLSVLQALQLLCAALNEGHVCLDLGAVAGTRIGDVSLPKRDKWLAALASHPAIGAPGQFKPLTLDAAGRLYLTRYWLYEQQLAKRLLALAAAPPQAVDAGQLRQMLQALFAGSQQQPDWQQAAAACAVLQRLSVISGGPGTGKTSTVVRLLAALQQMHQGRLVIRLAAPTGKAAARMSESIRAAKPGLQLADEIAASIPESASTLHRLLGSKPDSAVLPSSRRQPAGAGRIGGGRGIDDRPGADGQTHRCFAAAREADPARRQGSARFGGGRRGIWPAVCIACLQRSVCRADGCGHRHFIAAQRDGFASGQRRDAAATQLSF
jgi:ATP-dependent exoDNAse (exonuclease V) alpha subunit